MTREVFRRADRKLLTFRRRPVFISSDFLSIGDKTTFKFRKSSSKGTSYSRTRLFHFGHKQFASCLPANPFSNTIVMDPCGWTTIYPRTGKGLGKQSLCSYHCRRGAYISITQKLDHNRGWMGGLLYYNPRPFSPLKPNKDSKGPLFRNITAKMLNLRTKNDLKNILQFLVLMQSTIFTSSNSAVADGIQQTGSHYTNRTIDFCW